MEDDFDIRQNVELLFQSWEDYLLWNKGIFSQFPMTKNQKGNIFSKILHEDFNFGSRIIRVEHIYNKHNIVDFFVFTCLNYWQFSISLKYNELGSNSYKCSFHGDTSELNEFITMLLLILEDFSSFVSEENRITHLEIMQECF